MTDSAWLLAVLADGLPHTHAEILRRSETERGHGLTVHSRAADLRKQGHDVQVTTWKANGRTHSSYRLVARVEPQPPSLPTGVDSCGSTGETAVPSAQPTTAGEDHPLVSPPGRRMGVGYADGDGQLALLDAPARGAYDEVAA